MNPPYSMAARLRAGSANAVTVANAICGLLGCFAMMLPAAESPHPVAIGCALVFAGFVFDRMDGFVARRLNVVSPYGALLDSLCDVLSFGLLPALLIIAPARLNGAQDPDTLLRVLVGALYLIAAIARLSRFSLAAVGAPGVEDKRMIELAGQRYYYGMPSPAAAMSVASLVLFELYGASWGLMKPVLVAGFGWATVAGGMLVALAMVLKIPFADPPKAYASREWPLWHLPVLLGVAVVFGLLSALVLFAAGYLVSGPLYARHMIGGDRAPRRKGARR